MAPSTHVEIKFSVIPSWISHAWKLDVTCADSRHFSPYPSEEPRCPTYLFSWSNELISTSRRLPTGKADSTDAKEDGDGDQLGLGPFVAVSSPSLESFFTSTGNGDSFFALLLGKDETSGRGLDSSTGGFDWTLHWRKEWFSRCSGKKEIAFLPAYDAGRWQPTFREDAKKVATCIPFLVPGQESNGDLGFAGGFRTEKWNRGGTRQRREKHLAPSDPIRSSSALSLLPYPQVGPG